jgi:hypothetical protein
LVNSGMSGLSIERRLKPRAYGDIEAGLRLGRFSVSDPRVALMLISGALLGLFQFLESHPEANGDTVSDDSAEGILRLLGLDATEAQSLAHGPLDPDMDRLLRSLNS